MSQGIMDYSLLLTVEEYAYAFTLTAENMDGQAKAVLMRKEKEVWVKRSETEWR